MKDQIIKLELYNPNDPHYTPRRYEIHNEFESVDSFKTEDVYDDYFTAATPQKLPRRNEPIRIEPMLRPD